MFTVHNLRGGLVESTHEVSVAVVDVKGRLRAKAGNPDRVTIMRSAAKPFQALPLVQDGATDRFDVSQQELALACASHNSERRQIELVAAWLERIECAESDLACGPHRPLWRDLAIRDPEDPRELDPVPHTPVASNCSGKHTGMLTLARNHEWDTAGYNRRGHPVQDRLLAEMARFTGVRADAIGQAVDGCAAVTFALPLRAMALGFAKLGARNEPAEARVVDAMISHPDLVAGTGRLCTVLMSAFSGQVIAKVGAEGVYGAALLEEGLGIAVKVEDGNPWACNVALLAVLGQLGLEVESKPALRKFAELPILNTRRHEVGVMRAAGTLAIA
jgi:L-asparaginase II